MIEMIYFELKKILIKEKGIFISILTIFISLLITINQYQPYFSSFETYKGEYIQVIDHLKNEDYITQIDTLKKWNTIIEESNIQKENILKKYKEGEITVDEYEKVLVENNKNMEYEKLYRDICTQVEHINSLEDFGTLEYTQGMDGLLYSHFDYIFLFTLILFSIFTFLIDESTEMKVIVNVTQNKDRILFARFVALILILFGLLIIIESLKYLIFFIIYGFPNLYISIQNSMMFQKTNINLNYFQAYLLTIFMKILWILLMSIIIQLICKKIKIPIYVFISTVSIIILTELFFDKGNIINFIPFISLFNPYLFYRGDMELNNIHYNGWENIDLIMFLVIILLIITLIIYKLYNTSTKKYKISYLFFLIVSLTLTGCNYTTQNYNSNKSYNSMEYNYFNESENYYFSLLNDIKIIKKDTFKHIDFQRDPFQINTDNLIDDIFIDENLCYYIERFDTTFSIKKLNLDDFSVENLYTKENHIGDYSILFDSLTLSSPNTSISERPMDIFVEDGKIFLEYMNKVEIIQSGHNIKTISFKNGIGYNSFSQGLLYYVDNYNKLNKYSFENDTQMCLIDPLVELLYIYNEKIYYTDLKTSYLYCCDLDGNNKQILLENIIEQFVIQDDFIYFRDNNNQLFKKKIKDNGESSKLLKKNVIDFYISKYDKSLILAEEDNTQYKETLLNNE